MPAINKSANTYMVLELERPPAPVKTIIGGEFGMHLEVKAVATARPNGTCCFIGKRGNDIYGSEASSQWTETSSLLCFKEWSA